MLHGIGGVGKTTLAAEITRQVLAHDPARVLADLSGELSVDGVFGAVSAALRHHLLLAGAQGPMLQILTAHSIDLDQLSDPAALPPSVRTEIAPHFAELYTRPRPPRATPADLPQLIDRLARTSLLAADPDEHTVFVHRWTASELERRCHDQGSDEQVRDAHQRAAEYWQWRVAVWPQNRHAAVHDDIEARHHLLACGDIEEAGTLTEHICLQLHDWGAWDHETALIHDTLPRLCWRRIPPRSTRFARVR